MELATLLRRCQQGDELAWEALVRQYQGRVYALAYHYSGNADEAQDIAQEIFVKVYRRLHTCRDPQRFLGWLLQLGRNACVDHARRKKVRPPAQDVPAEGLGELADTGPRPDQDWESHDRQRLLHRALRRLSELSREVLVLKDIQGLSVQEVASVLGVPVGTVKSRSSRARVELAREIVELTGDAGEVTP